MWRSRKKSPDEKFLRHNGIFARKYRIIRKISQGSHGAIYAALDLCMDRHVALKILLPQYRGTKFSRRFDREAKLLARIDSPHVVVVYDSGVFEGIPWLAMPYYEGSRDLWSVTESAQGPLPLDLGCRILLQVATGLEHMHHVDVIHRDLTPRNILIVPRLRLALIIDLGLGRHTDAATITATGTPIGSVGYMAPEMMSRRRGDGRADCYSLGVIAYQVLTGQRPTYQGLKPSDLRAELRCLDEVIMRALRPRPEDRFQSATEMRQAFESALCAAPWSTASWPERGEFAGVCDSDSTSLALCSSSDMSWEIGGSGADGVSASWDVPPRLGSERMLSWPRLAVAGAAIAACGAVITIAQLELGPFARVVPPAETNSIMCIAPEDEEVACFSDDAPETAKAPEEQPRAEPRQKRLQRRKKQPETNTSENKNEQEDRRITYRIGPHKITVPESIDLKVKLK